MKLSFTQKVIIHKRMICILRQSKSSHSQSAADKLEATLNGVDGVLYSGAEKGRKEAAYWQALFQLQQEGEL